jgi:hypothetical protein
VRPLATCSEYAASDDGDDDGQGGEDQHGLAKAPAER